MTTSLRVLIAGLIFATGAACSGAGDNSTFPGGSGATGGGGGSGGGGGGGSLLGDASPGGTGGGTGGGGSDGCADATRYVYVIDADNTMYRFDPMVASKAAFTAIGPMGCQGGDGPNSMAIGRDGFAYVLYGTQNPYFPNQYTCAGVNKVNINTAACAGPSAFQCGSAGFQKFGMGFATDSANTTTEALYLSNSLTPKLGRVDLASGQVTAVGNLPGAAEFTGNAKGELWGFFPDLQTPSVLQIDKASGGVLTTLSLGALPPIDNSTGYAYAFAYWGGAFYIFYQVDGYDTSTNVWKLETSGSVSKYIPNTGLRIVGAGVSTCAPVEQPK